MHDSGATGQRPTGTVTFLISDVVGSTAMWQRFPEEMPGAIAAHEHIMRGALATSAGYEFGTAGDSFAVAFSSAADAIMAAVAAQTALAAYPWAAARIDVRIGIHSGQSDERDGRYFGPTVNRAARLEALGGPGQVLISQATHALALDEVGTAITFRDLGDHALESFESTERVFQVLAEGMVCDLAPTARVAEDKLPRPPTTFVGREDDIEQAAAMVRPGELVTITGLGGLGKTRLAIEAARRAAPRFADGVRWVDLTPLSDGSSMEAHTATELGITLQTGMSNAESIVDGLRRQQLLVVLDNCEHVIGAAAELVAALRGGCPELGVLATSREPLVLAGEQNWLLSTMTSATDGVALLVDRARAHDASFDPDRWPAEDLVDLCNRLDGMPLAIEMAAARLRALSPREIIDRLDDRFRLLKSRDRGTAARHQTLLAALDWSYELLEPDERLFLDRLSIFTGSFDVHAAVRVCGDEFIDEFDIIDLLDSLLEKSLVSQAKQEVTTRYRMLETVRQYCHEHLDDDETARLRSALTSYATEVATINEQKWLGNTRAEFDEAFDAFTAEWDNFRDAVRWAIAADDSWSVNAVLRSLWIFAFETFRTEIAEWARASLQLTAPPITGYGVAAATSNSREESRALLLQGLADVDESVPNHEACLLYGVLHGMNLTRGGDEVLALNERCVFHASAMSQSRLASHRANLASHLVETDPGLAAQHAEFSLAYLERSTNPWRAACVAPLAIYEARRGRPEVGHNLCTRGVEITTDGRLAWTKANALAHRARISLRYDVGDPRADLAQALSFGRSVRAWYGVWTAMAESVPWLHAHEEAELHAIVASYMKQRNIWYRPVTEPAHEEMSDLSAVRALGARMGRDELIDYVLHELTAGAAA